MRKMLLSISVILLSLNVNAQVSDAPNDWDLIQKTINLYIDGQATGDSVKVGSSFDDSWQLKYFADNELKTVTKAQYIVSFTAHAKPKNWSGRTVFIDITNNVAIAKVEISTATLLFVDYFHFIKTNKGWLIVDKISTRTPHKTVEVPVTKAKQ
ncbi:nuclear transport factor 2 family protein [Flavobacterium aquidurense]|uniref:Putative dehydrogenase n=1 Tax=Flavobacterium aquidurense TaxID=362413 RepID=A0A0Q0SB24_9FLAO|nr:nuclear transport factor 2 family protein [Flavobacterium aquidurense]KQB42351.1 putative dehydrogenase [Flavobacterium aquidurense]